jgi:hypothetical protein
MSKISSCKCAVITPTISLELLFAMPKKVDDRLISPSSTLGECHSAVTLAMDDADTKDE